jgi:hypothetical protein
MHAIIAAICVSGMLHGMLFYADKKLLDFSYYTNKLFF